MEHDLYANGCDDILLAETRCVTILFDAQPTFAQI